MQVKCERGFRSLLFLMILTLDFTFLKKIKKGEAYYIFILYILIFYLLRQKRVSVFKGLEIKTPQKNCVYPTKKSFSCGVL